ncbi:alpha/beta hydrolase [Nocardioides limicola]|uniref:alpha/beta hydrolase n=1 Tax=Nocardioides limicola TaxID=2803368 RepID=UPI00193BC860|nr:alpha/beta hydrolase [Nocardioides sp. DJM-14]
MSRILGPIVAALLLLTGGVVAIVLVSDRSPASDPAPTAEPSPTRTPEREPDDSLDARTPPDPALARFYEQTPDWERCRGGYECARIMVPLSYADPGSETIELLLLRVTARNAETRLGSMLVNPGGPGAPGTSYAEMANLHWSAEVRDAYDIVGFDPRGTGESAPVDCLGDAELDEYLSGAPWPMSPAEVDDWLAQDEMFLGGCAEKSGRLAGHVTTVEAARDMDVIRAVLDESTLTYFGASYGTKLGATYAELFPQRVGRLVLDGGVDVSLAKLDKSMQQAAGFETALRAYVSHCVSGGSCFLGNDVDEGLTQIQELLDEIANEPLRTSAGRELRIGNAFYGLVTPLYNRDYWNYLDTGLRTALTGDGSMLLLLSDAYHSRSDNGYENNASEAIYVINCLDDPSAVPADQVPDIMDDFLAASPTFGEIFAWGMTGCAGLPYESSEEPLEIRAAGAAPILVTGTTRDPATPMQWAESLAEQLESGILIRRDGDGHTAYGQGNSCVDEVVDAYLLDGEVPDGPVDC